MQNYLENLIRIVPEENKEYNYITTINISVPILRCVVKVIKRKETGLQLAEEMVMKLLDNEVTTVSELAEVLGLNNDIIEEILGRLHVKDFIAVTAGNCILLSKGRKVLKELKQIKLENENIAPVFINLITEEIYTDKYNNQVDKYINKENVLNGKIKIDIDYINKNFEKINEIFDMQQKTYGANKLSKATLFKIEDIEENKVQYLNLKSNICKSKIGDEIEICSQNNGIDDIQNEVLNQIINQNKFKYIFRNRNNYKVISDYELEEKTNYQNDDIRAIIKSYNKLDLENQRSIENKFNKIYKNDRALIDNELGLMIEELSQNVKEINLYVSNLSKILFDEEYMIPLCKAAKKKIKVNIYFNEEKNLEKVLKSSKKKFPEIKEMEIKLEEIGFKDNIIRFGNEYEIRTEYYDIKVIGEKYVTKPISYLVDISK
jgi:hypothetical protein